MAVVANLLATLGLDPRDFDKNLSAAEKRLNKATAKMAEIGRDLSAKVTLPIVAVGGASLKAFSSFDDAMTQSTAIMNVTSDQLERMESVARKTAKEIVGGGNAAARAAQGYFFLASAGFDAEQSMAALPQVARFAKAGMFDLATATDLSTDAQSALGLTSKDSQENLENLTRVTDVLVAANKAANASVQQFATSLTTEAAAAARNYNVSLEETVAVLAAFATQGVKGEKAGTRFRLLLDTLADLAVKNADAFDQLNIRVFDQEGAFRNLADIIEDFEKALSGAEAAEKSLAFQQLDLAIKTRSSVSSLIGFSDEIRNWEQSLKLAGGTTKRVSDDQLASFSQQMGLLRARIADVGIELGSKLAPILLDLVPVFSSILERVVGLVGAFGELDPLTQKISISVVGLTAAAGPFLLALAGMLKLFASLKTSVPILAKFLGGPLSIGIGVATAAITKQSRELAKHNRELERLQRKIEGVQSLARKTAQEELSKVNSQLAELNRKYEKLLRVRDSLANTRTTGAGSGAIFSSLQDAQRELDLLRKQILAVEDLKKALRGAAFPSPFGAGGSLSKERRRGGQKPGGAGGGADNGGETSAVSSTAAGPGLGFFGGEAAIAALQQARDEFNRLSDVQRQFSAESTAIWDEWQVRAVDVFANFKIAAFDAFQGLTSGIGQAFASAVVFGENFEESMKQMWKQVAAQAIATFTQIVIEWGLALLLQNVLGTKAHATRMFQAAQLVYMNAFAATAAIPIIGPFIAPGVAASSTAAAVAGSVAAGGIGGAAGAASGVVGLDTGGMLTSDGIAMLHEGEVVATPDEVKTALEGGSGRGMDFSLHIDGRRVARAILPHLVNELRLRGV